MRKRRIITLIIVSLFLPLFLSRTIPLKAAEEEIESYLLSVSQEQDSEQAAVTLTIAEPMEEELILSYENLILPDLEELNQIRFLENSQSVLFSKTSTEQQLLLQTTAADKPLTISFSVTKKEDSQSARLQLYSAEGELLADQTDFMTKSSSDFLTAPSIPPPTEDNLAEKNAAEQERQLLSEVQNKSVGIPMLTPEQEEANDIANQKANFDPLLNVEEAATWEQFSKAYNNSEVTKIVLTADLSNQGVPASQNLTGRSTSIEIDGQGHLLFLRTGSSLVLNTSGPQQIGSLFHMHDLIIDQESQNGYSWSFVNGTDGIINESRAQHWRFRLGNISTPKDKRPVGTTSGIGRIGRFNKAELTVYGKWNVKTAAENFYTGSMIYEDNTQYMGETTYYNYSVIWHVLETETGRNYTGESMEHRIGKNVSVYLKNSASAASNYPAVYSNFSRMSVGEGSTYSANMLGNAVSLYYPGASLVLESGATANLLTRGSGAVISFCNNDTSVQVQEGASLFVSGTTDNGTVGTPANDNILYRFGLVDFRGQDYSQDAHNSFSDIRTGGGSNRTFVLDNPKAYDFNNKLTNTTGYRARVIEIPNDNGCYFKIKNSDVDLWKNDNFSDNPSSYSYTKVNELLINGREASMISSSSSELATVFRPNEFRRMSAVNEPPQLDWVHTTDADKSYELRVKIGDFPDSFNQETGEIIKKPVYAAAGQVSVVFEKSFDGNVTETVGPLTTDAEGRIKVTNSDDRFNRADEIITAKADRGGWENESGLKVIDITPPEPVTLKAEEGQEPVVTNATKQLIAENCEPNATFTLIVKKVSEELRTFTGVVDGNGQLIFNLPEYLTEGDRVIIYLQDNAGAAELSDRPVTNTDTGNINPDTDLIYREAVFKAPTEYLVRDVLPNQPGIEKTVINPADPVPIEETVSPVRVGDLLTYKIDVINNKPDEFDAVWKNVVVEDTLTDLVDFDESFADIQLSKNGSTAEPIAAPYSYSYDAATRKLEVSLGDLAAQEAVVITFKVQITDAAVGHLITNEAEAVGESPREENFSPGPENPAAAKEMYSVKSSVASYPKEAEGILAVSSFPETINFYSHSVTEKVTTVNNPAYSHDLKVKDQRSERKPWSITVKLTKELTLSGNEAIDLRGAIYFMKNGQRNDFSVAGSPVEIIEHTNANSFDYNVSSTWSEGGDGFKLSVKPGQVRGLGTYRGEMVWDLVNAYQGEDE